MKKLFVIAVLAALVLMPVEALMSKRGKKVKQIPGDFEKTEFHSGVGGWGRILSVSKRSTKVTTTKPHVGGFLAQTGGDGEGRLLRDIVIEEGEGRLLRRRRFWRRKARVAPVAEEPVAQESTEVTAEEEGRLLKRRRWRLKLRKNRNPITTPESTSTESTHEESSEHTEEAN